MTTNDENQPASSSGTKTESAAAVPAKTEKPN
jgi:hypothetical protein